MNLHCQVPLLRSMAGNWSVNRLASPIALSATATEHGWQLLSAIKWIGQHIPCFAKCAPAAVHNACISDCISVARASHPSRSAILVQQDMKRLHLRSLGQAARASLPYMVSEQSNRILPFRVPIQNFLSPGYVSQSTRPSLLVDSVSM